MNIEEIKKQAKIFELLGATYEDSIILAMAMIGGNN